MNWLCSILGRSSAKTENRYCVRFPTIGKIRISWQDRRGKTRRKRASIVNMSGTGALIKYGAFIPPGGCVATTVFQRYASGTASLKPL